VLVEALANPLLRESALISLAAIGPPAEQVVPPVMEILKEPPVNMKALELLFPVLYEIELRETNLLRAYAAMVISKIESANPRRALPALTEALRTKPSQLGPEWTFEFHTVGAGSSASCRISDFPPAMVWFVELDPANATALPHLTKMLTARSHLPQTLAAWALCSVPGLEREVADVLANGLSPADELGIEFPLTCSAIKKMGPRARTAAPALGAFINNKTNVWVKRRTVFKLLENIDPDAARGISLR
jgi:hypothetical protein